MAEVQPTPKLMNILYTCANGRLPWGQDWDSFLPLCSGLTDDETGEEYDGYVLCCGHTLNYRNEAPAVVGAGLMLPGSPDKFGRPTLTITKQGREFLRQHIGMVELDG